MRKVEKEQQPPKSETPAPPSTSGFTIEWIDLHMWEGEGWDRIREFLAQKERSQKKGRK